MTGHPSDARGPVDDPVETLRPPNGVGEPPAATVGGRPAFDVTSVFGQQRPRANHSVRPPQPVTADVIDRIRPPVSGGITDLSRRRMPPWQWMAAVAAVVALLAGAGALIVAGGGDGGDDERVATDDDESSDRLVTATTDDTGTTPPDGESDRLPGEAAADGGTPMRIVDPSSTTTTTGGPPGDAASPPPPAPGSPARQAPVTDGSDAPEGTMSPMVATADPMSQEIAAPPSATVGSVVLPTVPDDTIESETTVPPGGDPTTTTTPAATTTTTTTTTTPSSTTAPSSSTTTSAPRTYPSTSAPITTSTTSTTTTTTPPSSPPSSPSRPIAPAVSIGHGSPADSRPGCPAGSCRFVAAELAHFEPNTAVEYECYAEGEVFGSGSLTTDDAGGFSGDLGCSYGVTGHDVWVVAGGVQSNTVVW